jgi:hypothetical protein
LEVLLVGVGGGRRSPRTDTAYADALQHSNCRWRRFWRCRACWANQRSSQMRRFQHWIVVVARRCRVCHARYRRMECRQYQHWSLRATALTVSITHGFASTNPGRLDTVNAKRCSLHSKARHAAKAALPPIVGRGWVGEDQVGKKGQAELGNGVATSVVAGKGAINPLGIPPMVRCGWEG